jgi:peptidoglycan/LPS O-acetylase OafA/YrhL
VARTNGFDRLGYFWSLAVEEQFYLVWPVIILAVPRRVRVPTMASLILVAGVCRGLYVAQGHFVQAYVLPWTRMDALAAGGLLASVPDRLVTPSRIAVLAGALLAAGLLLPSGGPWATINEWGAIALCGAAVLGAARGFPGSLGRLLSEPSLLYVGTISYGLYVWYPFFLDASIDLGNGLAHWWTRQGFSGSAQMLTIGMLAGVWASLAWASLSWHWFERPINNLKRLVPYV